jgi:hypothetical protein
MRWLWINAMGDNDNTFPPVAPVLLQFLHVTAIRVNGGPNLVTGPIHLSCFQPGSELTGGYPSREMNTPLFAGDVVTVTIADSNPAGQVNTFYSAQIKTDSASSSSGANTAVSTVGPQIYWLGSTANTNLTVAGNGSATWTSDPAPVDGFVSYWYQGTTDSGGTAPFQDQLVLSSLTIGLAVVPDYVAGFPMVKPQDDLADSTICKGQELHLEILAGETVNMVFENMSNQTRTITVAWALTP